MILEFSVGNFRSFKEICTFSALADTRLKSLKENIYKIDKLSILRTSVIYGPNAGGKSNFALAYYTMLNLLKLSFKEEKSIANLVENFALDNTMLKKPTYFELKFLLDSEDRAVYRLGFEIMNNKVTKEWLYRKSMTPKSREIPVYIREGQELSHGNALPGSGVITTIDKQSLLRENSLLFSLLDSLNNPLIQDINHRFLSINISASALFLSKNALIPESIIEDQAIKKAYLYLLRKADTGIEDFKLDKNDPFTDKEQVLTAHTVLNSNKEKKLKYFPMQRMESRGTLKIFNLLGVILTTLKKGGVLLIDEIDTQLHPHLTRLLFDLFNDPSINLNNAQLIAITHEHSLLNHPNIRKDQVWFVQKNKEMASELYSLADFQEERSVHTFGKRYLAGQYGAVPSIGDINFLNEYLFETDK